MTEPGYRHFRVAPDVEGCGLAHAATSLESPYGRIEVAWELGTATGDSAQPLHLRVIVHANTQAEVRVPGGSTVTVGSGTHDFFGML